MAKNIKKKATSADQIARNIININKVEAQKLYLNPLYELDLESLRKKMRSIFSIQGFFE